MVARVERGESTLQQCAHDAQCLRPPQTQTVVTTATAIAILHLRNAHSVYIGAGATVAAFVGEPAAPFLFRRVRVDVLRPSQNTQTVHTPTQA